MTVDVMHRENAAMDICKLLASCCVVVFHSPAFASVPLQEYFYKQCIFRFCVPFFFGCSGYFFYRTTNKLGSIRRIAWLYVLSTLLYLPAILQGVGNVQDAFSKLRWNLVFGYEHLWYLAAALEGMILWVVLEKIPGLGKVLGKLGIPGCVGLLLAGTLLDEYYQILGISAVQRLGDFLSVFGGPRNVVFMGFPLLFLGGMIAKYESRLARASNLNLFLLCLLLWVLAYQDASFLLHNRGSDISNDVFFFGCGLGLLLLVVTLRIRVPLSAAVGKRMRKLSESIYILHPMVGAWVSQHLVLPPAVQCAMVILMCCVVYLLTEKAPASKGRKA